MRSFLSKALDAPDAEPDLFQTIDWFEHLAAHGFVDGVQDWLLGVDTADPSDRFVLPLARTSGQLASLSNYYSSLYGVVGAAPSVPGAWRPWARALRADPAGTVLTLQPLDDDAPWAQALQAALREEGFWVDRFECFGNWFLRVGNAGFDAYFAARPAALRHGIERGRRRLARAGGYSLEIHREEGAGLEAAIAAFETVYAQSWKQSEPCPQFMPGLARLAARRGWLRLGILSAREKPVAAQIWLVQAGKANIYKLAYIRGFERFSPGSVLTAALMRHVMEVDDVHEVDYLTGDDPYKRDWMSHRRVRTGLVAFAWWRARGVAAAARHFGGRTWRRLLARRSG